MSENQPFLSNFVNVIILPGGYRRVSAASSTQLALLHGRDAGLGPTDTRSFDAIASHPPDVVPLPTQ
jgi:hypothetical protein